MSASAEIARRRRVRGSLEELSKLCELTPAAHHSYIMKHLELVTRGDLSRLLISAPPGRPSTRQVCSSPLFTSPTTRQRRSSQLPIRRRSQSASAGACAILLLSTVPRWASSSRIIPKPRAAGR